MAKNYSDFLVSVIVITYNSSEFVLETLESVKEQTYRNIELIISDDASTDETVKICHNWLNDNRKQFLGTSLLTVTKNTGIPSNCNRGIKAAKGKWIKFIAGDDALYPNAIELNMFHVTHNPHISVLFSAINEFDTRFKDNSFIQKRPKDNQKYFYSDSYTAFSQFEHIITRGFPSLAPSIFIKREAILSVEGFDERYKLIEDFPLWYKLTKKGIKLNYLDEVTVKYRRHISAIDNNNNRILPPKESFECYESMRQEYVYPYITRFFYYKYRYQRFLFKAFNKFHFDKSNAFNKILYLFLFKILNPFITLDYLLTQLLGMRLKRLKKIPD